MARELATLENLEVWDELPAAVRTGGGGGGRKSESVALVEQIIGAADAGKIPFGKPIPIMRYDKSGGAAGGAGQIRRKFGPPEAYGIKVATRKTGEEDGVSTYAVFVSYDPSWKVKGEDKRTDAKYKEYTDNLKTQAKARADAKAAAESMTA